MRKIRLSALLAAIALVFSILPTGAFADGDRIEIFTASQLRELSRSCRLDSWSIGKTVVLQKDIDLKNEEFEPIASFSGRFEGGGHSISGLKISSGGSAVGGLFRYIGEEGVVRELTVEGAVSPEINAQGFGGIAGENRGEIINCTFHGSVSGRSDIGGIVGVNGAEGYISGCRSLAQVSGEHYTGGIAGRNLGSIFACSNLGGVNTTNPEIESEGLDINWHELNSTENVSAHTDTGGIAGYSEGRLVSCSNRGNVGYPHVGYNVGGVVGRQSGFMDSCRNFGTVNGRKDVGGVVGQLVPSITLHFSSTALSRLNAEMDALKVLLDDMIGDFENSSNDVSSILSEAGSYLENAGKSASLIGDALVSFVDGNIQNINDFAALAAAYIERMGGIAGNLEECFSHVSAAMTALGEFVSALESSGEEFSEVIDYANYAIVKLGEAEDELSGAIALCRSAATDLKNYAEKLGQNFNGDGDTENSEAEGGLQLPDRDEIDQAVEQVQNGLEEFTAVISGAIGKVDDAFALMEGASDKFKDAMENGLELASQKLADMDHVVEALTEPLDSAFDELGLASDALGTMAGAMEELLTDLGRENTDIFNGLGQDFMDETDRMEAALLGLSGQMERLNQTVNSSVGTVSDDLRDINSQFFKVMDCFVELLEGETDVTVYEDMSEEELFEERDGKIQSCENRGSVAADVNVGGICGTMAVEYDIDPEEDISVSGASGGSFRFFTNAVLLNCVNYDSVSAKKDGAGGAVGYMDLGVVYGCENYGEIKSLSGDYVGGIAGQSAAAIRNSKSLCVLSGRDYVGGIAGSVESISGCRSIVRISAEGGFIGAIAGELTGEASENYFVGEECGGIDGVSYSGKAEPLEYDAFMALGDLPGEFTDFKLTFVAENIMIKSIGFKYGESFDLSELPKVPDKVGHVGEWEKFDYNKLTFSDVVEAVYTPFDKVVASSRQVGKRAVVLLEGAFLPGSVPEMENCGTAPEGSIAAWTVKAVGSTEDAYSVRFLRPESRYELAVQVLRDGEWSAVDYEVQTSYLVFPAEGESCSFAVTEIRPEIPVGLIIAVIAAGTLLALAVIAAAVRSKKKKNVNKKNVNK